MLSFKSSCAWETAKLISLIGNFKEESLKLSTGRRKESYFFGNNDIGSLTPAVLKCLPSS